MRFFKTWVLPLNAWGFMNKLVLEVKDLVKQYPSRQEGSKHFLAVDHISFALGEGEILGLLGPNGAGKTTTIQMLLSTLTPTGGAISFFGKDFFKHRSEILQDVGFASTYVSMPAHLTVHENLTVHGQLYGLRGQRLKNRIEKFLNAFSAWDIRHQEFGSLSAGQKTRAMLAKAFVTHPKVVLLDEPTAALDPDIAYEVRKFILAQQRDQNVSILFTSHNMDEVTEVCNRVLVLRKGVIIADDTPDALASSVSTSRVNLIVGDGLKRTIAYALEKGFAHTVKERWIEIALDEHKIADLLMGLAQVGVTYSQIWIEKPSLEDYFLHIAQGKRT